MCMRIQPGRLCRRRKGAGLESLAGGSGACAALIAVEATGGFETVVAAAWRRGLPVVVVNPAQVRAFAQALGKRAKTDPIDAAVIARFVEAAKPEPRPLPDATTQLLADLVARRRQIVEMMAAEGQRERRLPTSVCTRDRPAAQGAREGARRTRRRDRRHVRGSPVWAEKEDLLASVPGVGPIVARTLIAEMPELGTLDRRQIAALAGLPPGPASRASGRQELHRRRTQNRAQRPLHGAMAAARHNPVLKAFRDRLIADGKPKMVALIAVARKLLTILNAILRDKKPWSQQIA